MDTKFTIKNFRVFDKDGVTVNIKPITVLTGCNSSGKSSIVKSMVLLNTYIESLVEDFKAFKRIDLKKHKLDFSKDETFNLGNFSRVLHKNSDEKTITFEYQIHPLILGEDIVVSLCFESDKNDVLCQGYIKAITIKKPSGEIIYSSSHKEPLKANYNLLINNFSRFAYGQYLANFYDEIEYKKKHLYGLQTEEEFHDSLKDMPAMARIHQEDEERYLKLDEHIFEEYYNSFIQAYGEESLHEIETWMLQKGNNRLMNSLGIEKKQPTLIDKWAEGNTDILSESLKYNTLFYFPLLEKLYNVDSKTFKGVLYEMAKGISKEKELFLAIDKISQDFISSKKKTFGGYFEMKEASFLKMNSKRFKNEAPFIGGTRFLRIESPSIDEGYLDWSRRMLGPVATEIEGNLVSMIGSGEREKWEKCPVDFALLYDVLMNIDYKIEESSGIFYSIKESESNLDNYYLEFEHRLFGMFKEYASMVIEEAVTLAIPQSLSYVATSLVNVKREYSFDSNDNFTNLVKRYFIAQRAFKNSHMRGYYGDDSFIDKWVRKLGIGHSVSIEISDSGSSFVVRLFKTEKDTVGTILAEEGYGITQIVTLLIRIETAIFESVKKVEYDYNDIPHYYFSEPTIAIEEPEVHLHPMLQSLLAEMFVDAYMNYHVHFIIETHSEYLIRKLQTIVAEHNSVAENVSILYVYDADISKRPLYTPQIKEIKIDRDGRLNDSFGKGFFDEADRLSMSLLDIKVKKDENE